MAKENTLWFPHDYNARGDERTAALIADHGAEGYGVYMILVEFMHESEDSLIEYNDQKLKILSRTMHTTYEMVRRIVDDCVNEYTLFKVEEGYFFSDRVFRNKLDRQKIREKRSYAGKLGGEANASNFKANASEIKAHASKNEANASKKRSKTKQIEANRSTGQDNTIQYTTEYTEEQKNRFIVFQQWIEKNCSNVAKMEEPFTIDQYLTISGQAKDKKGEPVAGFPPDTVKDVLMRMHNWKDLNKKNATAYYTFLNWVKRNDNAA